MSSAAAASIGPPQPPPPPTSPEEEKCLNLELWHACASPLVCLPSIGTRVVYFPQGHNDPGETIKDHGGLPCHLRGHETMHSSVDEALLLKSWCFFSKTLAEREVFCYVVDNAAVMDFITVNTSGSILINLLK